tara:strand:+ start:5093 stop:5299 length:207 start_codon:yes stop_codon:yes gene_type:complete
MTIEQSHETLFIKFTKELKDSEQFIADSVSSYPLPLEEYHLNVGKVQAFKEAQATFKSMYEALFPTYD